MEQALPGVTNLQGDVHGGAVVAGLQSWHVDDGEKTLGDAGHSGAVSQGFAGNLRSIEEHEAIVGGEVVL